MLSVNVAGLLYCAHAALPHLLEARRGRTAAGRRPGQHQLGRRPRGPQRQRRLQPDQARRRGVQRVAAPGGHERHVRVSLVEPGAVSTELASHNRPEIQEVIGERFSDMRAAGGERHRRRHHLRRHPAAPRRDQRGPDPADRAGGLSGSAVRPPCHGTSPYSLRATDSSINWGELVDERLGIAGAGTIATGLAVTACSAGRRAAVGPLGGVRRAGPRRDRQGLLLGSRAPTPTACRW